METTRIGLTIPVEADEAIEKIMRTEHKGKSDVIREALEMLLKSRGYDVPLHVERGGWRGGTAEEK